MISVALTTYNGEKYVLEQLQSIKEQSHMVDEVIICDDGSRDSTIKLVKEFIQTNQLEGWQVIQNEHNLGYSKNFFKAVQLCKGDYIFLSDQDDIWNKDKVKIFLSVMEKDDNIYAVSSSYITIDETGRKKDRIAITNSMRDIQIQEVVGSSNIKGCTMCIRKELDDFIPHDDLQVGLQLGHDWYYNFLACLLGRDLMIPDYLLFYRIHGQNISLQRNQRTSVLATNKSKRLAIFVEMEEACKSVLERCKGKITLDTRKIEQVDRMLDFCITRKKYVGEKNISVIGLLKYLKEYKIIGQGWKGALHAFLSDFLYANEIDWRLKRR